jgi:hypothetical protein
MTAIYSNGGNRWNILGFNFTKRDALSGVYKKYMMLLICISPILEQSGPLKPGGHSHWKHFIPSSVQFPPFLQGPLSHGRTGRKIFC